MFPYNETSVPVILKALDNFEYLFKTGLSVSNAVPLMKPKYPLKIVRGTSIASVISAEFLALS